MTYGQHLHQPGLALAAGSSTATPGGTILKPYKLEPPEWRAPLIANKEPPLYPDLFPGATALYPQSSIQLANAHVPGVSRDSSASASSGSHHFIPVAGVTASKEDELSDTVTKLGFVNKAVVQTEHFSAHALIFNKLNNGPSIHALGKIIQRVLDHQQKDETLTPTTGPWTYKPPSRVVYNASRLESWYAELANPSVPLSKLAKTIPSAPSSSTQPVMSTGTGTYTGASSNAASPITHAKNMGSAIERNVDMVITRQIPLDRAFWFLQAVGQNDIAQLSKSKNLQVHPCTSYSVDYTNALVDALKRQINEALLPLAQFGQAANAGRLLPGMTVRGRPRNVLAEDQNRDRWLARFDYTLALLQASLSETMLDRQHLCELLLQNMASSSQVQLLWWMSTLLQTVIDDMLETTWMGQKLAHTVFHWLLASQEDTAEGTLPPSTCQDIGSGVLRALWLTDYNLFLIPEIWQTGVDEQLQAYLGLADNTESEGDHAKWDDLAGRVAMLLCRISPTTYGGHLAVPQDTDHGSSNNYPSMAITHRETVQILDGWSASEPVQSLVQRIFSLPAHGDNGSRRDSEAIEDDGQITVFDIHTGLIQVLLRWATTTARRGKHRPWLVAAILAERAGVHRSTASGSAFESSTDDESVPEFVVSDCHSLERVRDATMSWLDAQEVALTKESSPIWTTQTLVLEMCMILLDQGVLEISGLLQKVIARGLQGHQGSHNEPGLYSLVLSQYSSSAQTSALHWQRRQVGILESGSSEPQRSQELAAAVLALEDRLVQQIRRQGDAHNPEHELGDAIERLCTMTKGLSPMEKAQVVEKSVMPPMLAILKRHLETPLDDSAVLGMLSLLGDLQAYTAQTQVMGQILSKHIITESALLAIIAMRRADKRLYAAIGHESHYATALLHACARLWTKSQPHIRALQELVNLGKRYELGPAHLRGLRNQLQIWQAYSTYRHPPQYLGSPIEADRTDIAFLDELVSFMNTYVANTNKQDCPSEEELAILTSICGGPPTLHFEVLPAMLVWVSRSFKFDLGATRLCALAATVACTSTPLNNQSPDQGVLRCGLEEVSLSFSESHCDLLVRLVREEAISLPALIDLIINPILQRIIKSDLPPIKTKSALCRLIFNLLTEQANISCLTWQIEAVRGSLFEGSAFFCTLRLARQLAVLAGREDSITQNTRSSEVSIWRPLLQGLLSSSRYQESFTASIEEIASQMLNAFSTQIDKGMADFELLWQSLNVIVEQWTAPTHGAYCANDGRDRTLLASRLLATGHYTVFTSPLARCYFKALFIRLGPEYSTRLGHAVAGAANATQRHDFARHCLEYILKSSIQDGDDQIRMFAEQHWDEFVIAVFEKLAQSLVSLAAEGGAIAIHDDQGRIAARQIYRLVDILTMVTASTSAVSPIKNDALASLIMDSVYHARSTISEVDSSGMTTGVILQQIQLFTRIICLAEVWLNAWPATSGTLGQIIAWLLVPTLGLAGKADLSFRSDVLAWLLQVTDVKTRRHCLSSLQKPLLSVGPVQDALRPWWQGHLSLGLPAPLTYLARDGLRYIILQRTWAGLSSSALEALPIQSGQKPNNEPQDLQKYGSRTLAIDRQLLPQFRDLPVEHFMGPTFDSEMPWDRETIFERDFRRISVPQVDLSSASSQSQLTRSGQSTINEAHNVQVKAGSTSQIPSATASKSANKGKGLGQPAQSTTKKRKNVPDVVIIEDNSPKKKSRALTSTSTGSKQQKKK